MQPQFKKIQEKERNKLKMENPTLNDYCALARKTYLFSQPCREFLHSVSISFLCSMRASKVVLHKNPETLETKKNKNLIQNFI